MEIKERWPLFWQYASANFGRPARMQRPGNLHDRGGRVLHFADTIEVWRGHGF
jgi:hypothetical protein